MEYIDLTEETSGGGTVINNQDITVTENGTVTADSGYTGLGTVTVNVPQVFKPELSNMQTIYKVVQNTSDGILTDSLFPSGTKDNLRIWNSNTAVSTGNVVGFVNDFPFSSNMNQLRIDMCVTANASSGDVTLFGYGGESYAARFSCPVAAIKSGSNLVDFYFSPNGSNWSSSQGLSDVVVNNNENTMLSFELVIENGVVVKKIYKDYEVVYTQITTDTAFTVPIRKGFGFFFKKSSTDWSLSNVVTDLTKFKIVVNGTTIVNGAEL